MNVIEELFSAVASAIKKLWRYIKTRKARKAVETAVELVKIAMPIVQRLSEMRPSAASLADVVAAYQRYGVPLLQDYTDNSQSRGNALLNLATELLKREVTVKYDTNILQTAVQLAVSAIRATD